MGERSLDSASFDPCAESCTSGKLPPPVPSRTSSGLIPKNRRTAPEDQKRRDAHAAFAANGDANSAHHRGPWGTGSHPRLRRADLRRSCFRGHCRRSAWCAPIPGLPKPRYAPALSCSYCMGLRQDKVKRAPAEALSTVRRNFSRRLWACRAAARGAAYNSKLSTLAWPLLQCWRAVMAGSVDAGGIPNTHVTTDWGG